MSAIPLALSVSLLLFLSFLFFFLPLPFSAMCLGRSWGYWKMLIKHATSECFAQNRIVVNWTVGIETFGELSRREAWEYCAENNFNKTSRKDSLKLIAKIFAGNLHEFLMTEDLILYQALFADLFQIKISKFWRVAERVLLLIINDKIEKSVYLIQKND